MQVRIATVDEMKELWKYSGSPTNNYFVDGINNGNIEFCFELCNTDSKY